MAGSLGTNAVFVAYLAATQQIPDPLAATFAQVFHFFSLSRASYFSTDAANANF